MTLRLRFQSSAFPLSRSLLLRGKRLHERRIFHLILDDGRHCGLGEAAPWTTVEFARCAENLATAASLIERASEAELPSIISSMPSPAARFALDTARLDLEARRQRVSLAHLLTERSARVVHVNALIDLTAPDECARQAAGLLRQGYACLKLKLGRALFEEDLAAVHAARGAAPDARIRLDANATWRLAEAAERLRQLAPYDIEYVEQPCADHRDILELSSTSPIPLALDESLTDLSAARFLEDERAAPRWILKPSRFGSFVDIQRALDIARSAGINVTLTHMFEGPVGLRAVVHAAAAWLPDETHGLDSSYASLPGMPSVAGGAVTVDSPAGLGLAQLDAARDTERGASPIISPGHGDSLA